MRALITGGTGFIGSRLGLSLLERGDGVKVLGQQNTLAEAENKKLLEEKGAEICLASVTDRENVFQCIRGVDVVFHLAAAQHEANVPDQVFWDVNLTGTQNVLEASLEAGVKKIVHGSTIGVYGSALEGNLDEESSLRPDNIYGVTKLEGEKLVLAYQDKLPVVVIRISETYGPGDRRLLKLFRAIKKRMFFMIGNGKNVHQLLYIDDLVQGLISAARIDTGAEKIFVLAGNDVASTWDMASIIADAVGTSLSSLRVPLWPVLLVASIVERFCRPLGIQPPIHRRRVDFFKKSFVFSVNRSKTTLDFEPRVDFRQGVRQTVQWYQKMGYL